MSKEKNARLRLLLNISATITLLVGLGCSIAYFLTAGEVMDVIPGYELEDTKPYLRNLELYGGKANVLAARFSAWFAGLWQGRSLAGTVACITIAVSAAMFWMAHTLPFDPESDDRR